MALDDTEKWSFEIEPPKPSTILIVVAILVVAFAMRTLDTKKHSAYIEKLMGQCIEAGNQEYECYVLLHD